MLKIINWSKNGIVNVVTAGIVFLIPAAMTVGLFTYDLDGGYWCFLLLYAVCATGYILGAWEIGKQVIAAEREEDAKKRRAKRAKEAFANRQEAINRLWKLK